MVAAVGTHLRGQFTTCLMILKLGHYNSNSLIWSGAQCKLQKLLKVLGIYVCIYEKRSSILLIFHIDNVVQQANLQGRRNWVGGQRGAIVPLDFYK